jgi:hypothetical protein
LAIRDEHCTTTELLQAIHGPIDNHVAAAASSSPQSAQGVLQRFLCGRFGQAIVTGAGIGIGGDIVNSIFDRL